MYIPYIYVNALNNVPLLLQEERRKIREAANTGNLSILQDLIFNGVDVAHVAFGVR